MQRILSIYTFAVAVGLFLLFLSPLLLLFYGPYTLIIGVAVLISGIMVAAFIYDYMKYAVAEWGEFTPQGVGIMLLFTLSYAIIYMSLMALAVVGDGDVNMVVWASVMISAAVMLYMLKNTDFHLTSGNIKADVMAGARTLPLALIVGLPLGWMLAALYEAIRMMRRGAYIAGGVVMLSIFGLPFMMFMSLMPSDALAGAQNALYISVFYPLLSATQHHLTSMQLTGVEVLTWPGIIGWEELTARFLLPAVGPLANYMFVVLHAPTRWMMALFLAPAILAVISMGTRWITEVYKRHGLIGSIAAHSVYNGMLSWLEGLILFPVLTLVTLIVLGYAYISSKSE